ncbi:hypothetical protein Pcar_3034 [Syntrophotalea carbinolica DSM 2380]|uniref:CARDB domain-containing protein n=1 Tax=Syntrophotalea carbinolica (strain DSM 2380 / NBRC 103641 / GraBd1) TaxID=338963 RepID=Q3A038_SYNC1|nr:hypothetical protein [Syntrophotalea carbinolica]ABA90269.1 hypothetical protein Pcar_3034 [Syntrophotalea carbinolica DSM 2380]
MRPRIVLMLLLLFVFSAAGTYATEGHTVTVVKPLTLHPRVSKNNPYSVVIPLDLKYTGRISLAMDVSRLGKGKITGVMNGPFRFLLLDPEYKNHSKPGKINKSFMLKNMRFGDQKKARLEYFIDDPELERLNGKYELMISNFTDGTFKGDYQLSYPGSREEAAKNRNTPFGKYPDLRITDMTLDKKNNVVITLVNSGREGVPAKAWKVEGRAAETLGLLVDGKFWGGAGLKIFDPEKKLRKVGEPVSFVMNYRVSKKTRLTARISGGVRERSKDNNELTKVLDPGQGRNNDLAVSALALDAENHIVVTVENTGTDRLDPMFWKATKKNACSLSLKINGKPWGGATLAAIDPDRKLRRPGGTASYTCGYTVKKKTRVSAVIDSLSNFTETDERNNKRTEVLDPAPVMLKPAPLLKQ